MKANRYGAAAEQCRARQGWVAATKRKLLVQEGKLRPGHIDGEKCLCCKHLRSWGRPHCTRGNFGTRLNCYCKEFEPREKTK